MRGGPLVYDGLWRCLCPGLDKPSLRQAVANSSRAFRAIGQDAARRRVPRVELPGAWLATSTSSWAQAASTTNRRRYHASADNDDISPLEDLEPLLAPTPPTEQMLRRASLDDITKALLTMRQPEGWTCHGKDIDRHGRIVLLVRHLLSERNQAPCSFIYECMMDAMVDPQGSAKGIRKLLDDMASQNIQPTSELYQSALAGLAVHPDYVLRQQVLDTMQEHWFVVDTRAKQSLVLGLLRDEQYELAYQRLTEMMDQKALIDLWVYDIFIMVFGRLGFIDEMLLLIFRRKALVPEDRDIAGVLYYALDVCSQAFHYRGTMSAWNSVVRTWLLQPSDGIVENVLATAARHGDTVLATEALDRIARRTRLLAHHYEAVVEAFAAEADVAGALRTLCVMHKNGVLVGRENTVALHQLLVRQPALLADAERSLRGLASPGGESAVVPLAAAAVVVEMLAREQGAEAAMALYGDLPRLCGEKATPSMLQALMMHSRDAETTRSLARDYTALVAEGDDDDVPSPHVYKALVVACAEAGELDLAFRFAIRVVRDVREPVAGEGVEPARDAGGDMDWVRVLLRKAVEVEDTRIWTVVDALGEDGDTKRELGMMLRQMRIARRAADFGPR